MPLRMCFCVCMLACEREGRERPREMRETSVLRGERVSREHRERVSVCMHVFFLLIMCSFKKTITFE